MLLTDHTMPQVLRSQILRRLHILKLRHESEGRHVPRSEDIDHALAPDEGGDPEQTLTFVPGPLEGYRRPTTPVPQKVTEQLEDAWTDSAEPFPFKLLAMASQFFALGESELERAREAVKTIAENNSNAELHENQELLGLASIVAAANRDTVLADGIADAVIRVASRISKGEDIKIILCIMLQAAAAYEAHNAWFKWLEERLAGIATHLPPPPNKSLPMFLYHLDAIATVLPINSWFHIPARSIASAGADIRP